MKIVPKQVKTVRVFSISGLKPHGSKTQMSNSQTGVLSDARHTHSIVYDTRDTGDFLLCQKTRWGCLALSTLRPFTPGEFMPHSWNLVRLVGDKTKIGEKSQMMLTILFLIKGFHLLKITLFMLFYQGVQKNASMCKCMQYLKVNTSNVFLSLLEYGNDWLKLKLQKVTKKWRFRLHFE